jgi:MoxR-like ATPase
MQTRTPPNSLNPMTPTTPMQSGRFPVSSDRFAGNENLALIDRLRESMNTALRGKSDVIELVLAALLSGGHILFDDLPGLGKTTLGKAIASAIGGEFGRLQGTPDLLPSDVTGFNILNRKTGDFEFRRGPVFSDVLLVDEINRATPRTQSALFEAMAERQVSVDATTWPLSSTFFVIATQNPLDSQGTFELPDAQLDRFAMKLSIGYPSAEDELAMLEDEARRSSRQHREFESIATPEKLARLQDAVAEVMVSRKLQGYFVQLAHAVRNHRDVRNGLSPRALIFWQRIAQASAMLHHRDFVTPEDIQHVAKPVLRVRLSGSFDSADRVIDEILASVPVPVE